jgi:GTPase SAR1 family protein
MNEWSNEDVIEWLKSIHMANVDTCEQWRKENVNGHDLQQVNEWAQFKPPSKFRVNKLLYCQRLFDALQKEREYHIFEKELQKRQKNTTPIPLIPDVTVDKYFVDYQEQQSKFKDFLTEFIALRDAFHNTLTTFEFKDDEREQLLLYLKQRMKNKKNTTTTTSSTITASIDTPTTNVFTDVNSAADSPMSSVSGISEDIFQVTSPRPYRGNSPSRTPTTPYFHDADDLLSVSSPTYKKQRKSLKQQFMKKLFDSNKFFIQDSDIAKLKNFSESNLTIAVIGDMRAGKSSFINALLGTELLPVDEIPCTSAICRIRYAETKRAIIHYTDTTKEKFEVDLSNEPRVPRQFVSQQRENNNGTNPFDYCLVEIYWPIPFLSRAIEIIDTPGFNENTYLTELVRQFLPQANAIVCLVNSGQTMTDSLSSGLEVIKHECGISSEIFVVANKFDLVAEEDRDKVREFIFHRASAQFPTMKSKRQILFHTISSKNVLEQVKSDRPIDPSFTNLATSLVEFIRMGFQFKIWNMLLNLEAQLDTCKRFVNDSLKSTVGSHQFAQEIISILFAWHHDCMRYLEKVKQKLKELIQQFWNSMTPVIVSFLDKKMKIRETDINTEEYEQQTQQELIDELEKNLSTFLNENVKRELEVHKFRMLNVDENEDLKELLEFYLSNSTMNNIAFTAHKQNLIDTLSVVIKFKKHSTLAHLFSKKSFKLKDQTSTQVAQKIVGQQILDRNVNTLLTICVQPLEDLIATMRGRLENMFTFEFVQLANQTDHSPTSRTDRIEEDYAKLRVGIEHFYKNLQEFKKEYFLQKYLVDIDKDVKIVKHVDREYERTFTEATFNNETVTVSYYNVTVCSQIN